MIIAIFGYLFIYSIINICTYIFGKERELHVTLDNHFLIGYSEYYVSYNNGKKMVWNKNIHLSFIESIQWRNNSGYVTFKQLGTHLTHRSAFVYSSIYFIIFIIILYVYIVDIIKKRNNTFNKITNKKKEHVKMIKC